MRQRTALTVAMVLTTFVLLIAASVIGRLALTPTTDEAATAAPLPSSDPTAPSLSPEREAEYQQMLQTANVRLEQANRRLEDAYRRLTPPTLLTALEAAGYDRSFDALTAEAMTGSVMSLPDMPCDALGAWAAIRRDAATRSIQLPDGVRLDLGGSAKGWTADQAVRRLATVGPALIDAGGDIAVSGPQSDGSPWPIGVADPRMTDEQIDLLLLARGGVATSGRDYRRWQQNGIWQHHLIDPRTLRPAITDLLSATVIGSSAAACEVAAKAVLLLGSRSGLAGVAARVCRTGGAGGWKRDP